MSPAQLAAVRAWLIESLQAPPTRGAPAVPFPPSNVVRAYGDHPAATDFWATIGELASPSYAAESDDPSEAMRQLYRIDVTGEPAVNMSVSIDPAGAGFDAGGVSVPPAGDPTSSRNALLVALQALEGPTHGALYTAADDGDDPAILVEGTEAARGLWLRLEVGPAELAPTLERDSLAVTVRDPGEIVLTFQVSTLLDERDPNPSHRARSLLEKVRTRFRSELTTAGLHEANIPPVRASDVMDLSHLLGGSQWQTRAALDLTFGVMRDQVVEPGTVEFAAASGTLGAELPTIITDTRTSP